MYCSKTYFGRPLCRDAWFRCPVNGQAHFTWDSSNTNFWLLNWFDFLPDAYRGSLIFIYKVLPPRNNDRWYPGLSHILRLHPLTMAYISILQRLHLRYMFYFISPHYDKSLLSPNSPVSSMCLKRQSWHKSWILNPKLRNRMSYRIYFWKKLRSGKYLHEIGSYFCI